MQPQGNSPFAINYPGSAMMSAPGAAMPSPFEPVAPQPGGMSPFAAGGPPAGSANPFEAAPSRPAVPSPFAAPPVSSSPFEVAPPVAFNGGPGGFGGGAGGIFQNLPEVPPVSGPFAAGVPLAQSPRVQDLESKGFRPLSSLPGGSVPSPTRLAEVPGTGTGLPAGGGFPAPGLQSGFESPFGERNPQDPAPAMPTFAAASPFEAVGAPQNIPVTSMAPTFAVPPPSGPVGFPPAPTAIAPAAPVPAPAPAASDRDLKIELSVREVLRDVAEDRLGFDPARVPGDVMARFPLSLVKPQLSTGRVAVRLLDVVEGCAEKYRPAFAKSDMECRVNLSIESIFHQLPLEVEPPAPLAFNPFSVAESPFTAPAVPSPVSGASFAAASPSRGSGAAEATPPPPAFGGPSPFGMGLPSFDTPFSGPAAADSGQSLPVAPFSAAPSPFGFPPIPAPAAAMPTPAPHPVVQETETKPNSLWDAPAPPAASASPAPLAFAGLEPLAGASPTPPPFQEPASATTGFPFLDEAESGIAADTVVTGNSAPTPWGTSGIGVPAPWGTPDKTPDKEAPTPWGAGVPQAVTAFSAFGAPAFEDDAVESFESLGSADEVVAPVSGAPDAFSPVAGFEVARFSDDKEQRSLRALFMSDEHFDAKAVVRHCEALPGVDACVLLSRSGEIRAGAGGGDTGFAARASAMLGAVISLAEGLGLSDAENFSMRTDKGMVSFFRAEPVYLGVQHSNRGFAPGVQEKLALASSELARMGAS